MRYPPLEEQANFHPRHFSKNVPGPVCKLYANLSPDSAIRVRGTSKGASKQGAANNYAGIVHVDPSI